MHKTIALSLLLAAGVASAQPADTPNPQAFSTPAEERVGTTAETPNAENALGGQVEPSTGTSSAELDTVPVEPQVGRADEATAPVRSNRLIEEIVVTATKRQESLSEVPLSISAFSGEKLEALGIESAQDLAKATPGLTFNSTAGFTQVYLRGVGSDAFLPSADATVPIYIDGVALLAGEGGQDTLGRVSRVEVVKGPQGTLFGRNSTGGAISIVTPDPGPDLKTDIQAGFGNHGTFNTQLFVNLPITETLGATISGFNQTHDTYSQNTAGPTVDTYSRGGRAKLVWRAMDNLSLFATGSYGEQSTNDGLADQLTRVSLPFRAIVPEDPKLDYRYAHNTIDGSTQNRYLFSAGGDWQLSAVDFKLTLSTQRQNDTYNAFDYDGSPLPLVSFASRDEYFKQSTAEFQILSTDETPFNQYFSWVSGLYYLTGKGGFRHVDFQVAGGGTTAGGLLSAVPALNNFENALNATISRACLVPGLLCPSSIVPLTGPIDAVSGGILASRSISGYFQGTTHLSEIFDWSSRVNLITGLRVDQERRGLEDNRLGIRNPGDSSQEIRLLPFSVPDLTKVFLPLKVQLQWFPEEGQQVYATFSRGYSSPTYSSVNFFSAPPPLKASRVDSYEIGTKLALLDGALQLNGAIFDIQQRNALTGFAGLTSGGVVEFENVPAARIYGVEGDFTLQPMPNLNPGLALVGSASYLNAKYTDYPEGRGYDPTSGLAFGPPVPIFGIPLSTQPAKDFTGNQISHTPKFSYTVGINQSFSLADNSQIEASITTNYQSSIFNDGQNAPEYKTPSFQLLDASVSYFYTPWGLQVTGFCNNITGEIYPASVFLLDTGRFQAPNDPRLYGARVKFTF